MKINRLFMAIACLFFFGCTADIEAKKKESPHVVHFVKANMTTLKSPKQVGKWKTLPTIEICESVSDYDAQIEDAALWWEAIGYNVAGINNSKKPSKACEGGSLGGKIVLKTFDRPSTKDATTYFHVNDDGEIKWAKIYFSEPISERIIEHELGHAFGWLHYDQENHIMNSVLENGGWDFEGLYKTN